MMNLILLSSCFKIPHPSKASFGGEDACFVSLPNSAIGVADGVGGWVNVPGSDAAKYSRDLMNFSKKYSYLDSPLEILEHAFDDVDSTVIGTTTATVAKLRGNNMSIVNVGDSGCSIFRDFHKFFQTVPTTHGFNFPYQLGYQSGTYPSNGTIDHITVFGDDVIVCASDGLWDNLYNEDIEKILLDSFDVGIAPQKYVKKAAKRLANTAFKYGQNKKYESPFATEAVKHGFGYAVGGKLDDTTVVVGMVQKKSN